MLAIQTHAKITDPDRFTFGDCRVHMRTQDEMLELFKDHEEAVWNSGKIADMCNFKFQTGKLFFPQFELPDRTIHKKATLLSSAKMVLKSFLMMNGLIKAKKTLYNERLDLEIALIIKMGFVGYFLVVSDFIGWARAHNIPVGPGRDLQLVH